jgi:hypothetical protein
MMGNILKISNPAKRALTYGGIWLLFWVVPWGKIPTIQSGNLLAFITEMPRLSLALLLVIIPGVLLYLLLKPKDEKFILYDQPKII